MLDKLNFLSFKVQDRSGIYSLFGAVVALLAGYVISLQGIIGAALFVLLPILLLIVVTILRYPKFGILMYVQLSFIVNGIGRFIAVDAPFGVSVDAALVLTIVSIFMNGKQMNWKYLRSPILLLVGIWFFYIVLEAFNPDAPSRIAWFFQFRAISFYWVCVTIILLVLPITQLDIQILIRTWLVWSLVAAFWAYKQQYLGLTSGEAAWLASIGGRTHILNGHLRSFSFYSDAAQFGAEMAYTTLLCIIRLFEEESWKRRIGYFVLAFFFFWGYAVSSTRGALFILLVGFPYYLFMKRDFLKISLGLCVAIPLFFLLKFTYIGNGNYQIFRIRTALNPSQDNSFLVRLANQEKLAKHLKSLPFGVGIGSSADTGARFSPQHFAAQIPPDSWYVRLWVETGVVGLTLYLIILVSLIGASTYKVWHLKDPWLRKVMISFLSGLVGVSVMGYSNPVMAQFPTNTMIFISIVLMMRSDFIEKSLAQARLPSEA